MIHHKLTHGSNGGNLGNRHLFRQTQLTHPFTPSGLSSPLTIGVVTERRDGAGASSLSIPWNLWNTLKYYLVDGYHYIPSGYVKIAIENGHRNSGFSHEKWWFSISTLNYQRVIPNKPRYKPQYLKKTPPSVINYIPTCLMATTPVQMMGPHSITNQQGYVWPLIPHNCHRIVTIVPKKPVRLL